MSASTLASGANLAQGVLTPDNAGVNKSGDTAGTHSAHQAGQAMVAVAHPVASTLAITPDGPVARLPVELEVGVPLRDFRVRNLLSLQSDVVVESQWAHGEDVPIAAGKVQLAWAEFEVMDSQLAVRVTRLA